MCGNATDQPVDFADRRGTARGQLRPTAACTLRITLTGHVPVNPGAFCARHSHNLFSLLARIIVVSGARRA